MQKEVHGGDIYTRPYRIDFSANINPLGTPGAVLEAACRGVSRAADYPDIHCRKLREAISRREGVDAGQIICGNGAAELIFALAQAVRPKRALLTAPGFAEYEQALRTLGDACQVEFYHCTRERGFLLGEDYLDRISPELDLIFLCNPNNPTGLTIPRPLLERIGEKCRDFGVTLVLDECFVGLMQEGETLSMKGELSRLPNLFILKAFTKLYAMAGLRLGYGLCANEELLARMRRVVQPWNVSIPAQEAGAAAMEEIEFEKRSRDYVAKELDYLKQGFGRLGITFWDSRANYLFFEGPADLYDRCAEEGILIRDCGNYRGLDPGYYRVAVKRREENEELLRVLKKILG